jgi:acyl carrier protein
MMPSGDAWLIWMMSAEAATRRAGGQSGLGTGDFDYVRQEPFNASKHWHSAAEHVINGGAERRDHDMSHPISRTAQEAELARLIVAALNLEVRANEIDPEAPLYGEGLGLDSIDMLEIALVVSKEFGVKLRANDENNEKIFSSLRSLNLYIRQNQVD